MCPHVVCIILTLGGIALCVWAIARDEWRMYRARRQELVTVAGRLEKTTRP